MGAKVIKMVLKYNVFTKSARKTLIYKANATRFLKADVSLF